MKIALLISGKLFSEYKGETFGYKNFYDSIYKTLIEPFNSDVFISTWFDDISFDEILDLYKPVLSEFENFNDIKEYDKYLKFLNENDLNNVYPSVFPMFYKIYKCNQLRLNYEIENNFKYDLIIRTRFDLDFSKKMEASTIEPFIFNKIDELEIKDSIENNVLYLRLDPYMGNRLIDNWVWDQFAFGNDFNMNIYCDTFLNLENILLSKRENSYINEMVLSYNLRDNNVSFKHTHTSYSVKNVIYCFKR